MVRSQEVTVSGPRVFARFRVRAAALVTAYRAVLAVVAVVVLFTFLANYAWGQGLISLPPIYVVVTLTLCALPLLLNSQTIRLLGSPVMAWVWAYACMVLGWFLFSRESVSSVAFQGLEDYGLGVITVLVVMMITLDSAALRVARDAVLVSVAAAAALNVYEVFHPGAFSLVPGRAAGLYSNPNISGSALVVGMALTALLLGGWKRVAYVLWVGVGTLATLSRAAIAGWLLVAFVIIVSGRTSVVRRSLWAVLVALAVVAGIEVTSRWEPIVTSLPEAVQTSAPRLGVGIEKPVTIDFTGRQRLKVAEAAWEMFSEHPLTGNGLGSTLTWKQSVSTHNMFLTHMAEFGILGLLVLPGLAWSLLWRVPFPERRTLLLVTAYVLLASLFSHNVLDEWEFLVAIGLAGAMATLARWRAQDQEARSD